MINFIYGYELPNFSKLSHEMFLARAKQFSERLKWNVTVDASSEERDEYDEFNPLYVIKTTADGDHLGSMRFMPTTGRTMINEHFLDLLNGIPTRDPKVWECTRFCLSAGAGRRVSTQLMACGAFILKQMQLDAFVGVFDDRIERIYSRIGAPPTNTSARLFPNNTISTGRWNFDGAKYHTLLRKAKLDEDYLIRQYYRRTTDLVLSP